MNTALSDKDKAVFSFIDKTTHKFDDTLEGEKLEHIFKFKNTGGQPLVISDYKVACSCTKVIYPKYPILPGKTAEIKVSFDTKGKYGYQDRVINLFSNASKKPQKIRIKVFVYKESESTKN